jgi:hypothetical protein
MLIPSRISRPLSIRTFPQVLFIWLFSSAVVLAHDGPHSGNTVQNPASKEETTFIDENEAAMNKMMAAMEHQATGDVDRDFVETMIPHHQGAIDMAIAVLKYGHNEQLKRLAQEIIVTQQQEIAAIRMAIGDPLPSSSASPTQPISH